MSKEVHFIWLWILNNIKINIYSFYHLNNNYCTKENTQFTQMLSDYCVLSELQESK